MSAMRPKPTTRSMISWATYDLANTIFSAIILTSYFPLYLTQTAGKNISLGIATTLSMILSALFVPFLGALCDQTGKTKEYLIRTTSLAVFFMACLSLTGNPTALVIIFILACFFYHASLVLYNSLLPVSTPPNKQGFASGLGTGLGYLGVVLVLPITHALDQTLGTKAVFAAAAFLFLLGSLPLFVFVPERTVAHPVKFKWSLWKTEWEKVFATVKDLKNHPAAMLFLGGNFFVVDALNSMIFWFLVYAREVFQPAQNELILILAGVNAAAFGAGILAGFLTDRFSALTTLILSSLVLCASLLLLSWTPSFALFAAIATTGGAFAIAGIWTAGRKALIDFSPKDKLGAYFGLYGLTTKISVLGSLLFSIVADAAGFRQALWVLIFPAVLGSALLIFSRLIRND